jgi:ubiquinone/menaquinone biosynthesis C-methylase UbiE
MKEQKNHVKKAYDLQAPRYDKAVGRGIQALMKQLLCDLDLGEKPTVLDVACGTGLSTFSIIEKTGGKGEFHGIDISEGMLEIARKNAKEMDIKNVIFKIGNAEKLNYPKKFFDVVISNMSFQFFQNKQQALKEMHRVLKIGGKLAILFGAGPIFKEVWEILDEVTVNFPNYPSFTKSIDDIKKMHIDIEETENLLENAGFQKIYVYARNRIIYNKPEFVIHDTPYAGYWKVTLPEKILTKVIDNFKQRLNDNITEKGFKSTWYVILAYATKVS